MEAVRRRPREEGGFDLRAGKKKRKEKKEKKETAYSRTLRCSSRHLGGSYDNCV